VTTRRTILAAIGAVAAATSLSAIAQEAATPVRLAVIFGLTSEASRDNMSSFRDEMRKLGWVDGRNIMIEYRYAKGDTSRLPALIAKVLRHKPDLIVVTSTPSAQAAKAATTSVPVVFSMVSDPVASGVVASLARPGGNLTGWSNLLPETSQKLLELLKEVDPKASRLAVLFDPSNHGKVVEVRVLQDVARGAGVSLQLVEARNAKGLKAAFASLETERPDGLIVLQDTVTGKHRKEIVEFAAKMRLPAIYQVKEFPDAGGLLSYGLNMPEQFRRSAFYVDKILRGARPSDLPVEQPTKFELVVNIKTAKALGLSIPLSILLRADRVIE
jgi:ABC-type uncharacterized transport system substrate-binding protein